MPQNSWSKFRRLLGKFRRQVTLENALAQRNSAVRALGQTERQFQILVESIADYAFYMLDAKGHITTWNSGAQRIKGYSAEEILGQHFSRFFTENDRQTGLPQQILESAVRDGRFESE